jgi:hypothetical protein
MSGTGAFSTTSGRELSSSFFFPARQGAQGNSQHSDRNIRLFPSWLGKELISTPYEFLIRTNKMQIFLIIYF